MAQSSMVKRERNRFDKQKVCRKKKKMCSGEQIDCYTITCESNKNTTALKISAISDRTF